MTGIFSLYTAITLFTLSGVVAPETIFKYINALIASVFMVIGA